MLQTVSSLAGVTVVFDLDGTLVDSAPDLVGALNAVLAERGLPPLPLDMARTLVGRGARALIERGFSAAGHPLDPQTTPALVERFIDRYRDRIAEETRPFEGVEAALTTLAARGATLGVCTNKRTDLSMALLDALDLTRHFAAVVGGDQAPASKPDPRHLWLAIEAAGGDARHAVLVGDSINDVDAARAAGVPSVVVSFGYTETPAADLGGDYLIDDYGALPGLIGEIFTIVD